MSKKTEVGPKFKYHRIETSSGKFLQKVFRVLWHLRFNDVIVWIIKRNELQVRLPCAFWHRARYFSVIFRPVRLGSDVMRLRVWVVEGPGAWDMSVEIMSAIN